jgi:D-sedoheptulose 7-phosphate isomerase
MSPSNFTDSIRDACREAGELFHEIACNSELVAQVDRAVKICVSSLLNKGTIFFGGNGGSAAESQHLAGELVSRFYYNRAPLRSVALNADTAILTAIGNDYGYERSLARSLEALGRPGDVLVALSTSGQSSNVVAAMESARVLGITNIGFTGRDGGKMADFCDLELRIPAHSTPRIQEAQLLLGHLLCQGIEASIFPEEGEL